MSSQANEHLQTEATLNVPKDIYQSRSSLSPFTALRHALCLAPALSCRPGSAPAPSTQAPPRSSATGPALPSGLGKQRVWRFRVYRVGLVFLRVGGMAAFDGPAKPLLSLNPQEDAKFKKEVAQVCLPPSLYETQIRVHFFQFGSVTKFRLSRSKKGWK